VSADLLRETIQLRYPRLLVSGVDGNDAQAVLRGFGVESQAAARACAESSSLAGVLEQMTCPLLIVHSGMDTVCPVEESERMRREAGGETTLVVFPEGNHVCDNIPYKVRPLMADWMACQLRAAPGEPGRTGPPR